MLERKPAVRHFERLCAGAVLDLGTLAENGKHHFDIDHRLPDLAIDDAHEIKRLVELNHHRVYENEIADRIGAAHYAMDAHRHSGRQPKRENDGLAGVEKGKRSVCLDAHALIAGDGFVVALLLALFRIKIFHGLEIKQAVDCLCVGISVAFVHRTPDCDPPIGGGRREAHIGEDHGSHDRGIAPVKLKKKNPQNQEKFDKSRNRGQHGGAHDRLDRIAATLENPC